MHGTILDVLDVTLLSVSRVFCNGATFTFHLQFNVFDLTLLSLSRLFCNRVLFVFHLQLPHLCIPNPDGSWDFP